MSILPQEWWVDPAMPVVGPAATPATIDRIVVHYTAAPKVGTDTAAYLRAIHRDYTVNRGYSIGYSFAADQTGRAIELRGLDNRCAANRGWNERTYAILLLVDGADPAIPPMIDAVREIVATIDAHLGRQVPIVGHRDIGATACPGDGAYAQVKSGIFRAPPPPPTDGDDMALHVQYTGPADGAARPELLLIQGKLVGFASPADRDSLIAATGATTWKVANPAQYDEIVRAYRT